MPKYIAFLAALYLAVCLSGCGEDEKVKSMRFYIEVPAGGASGEVGKNVTLPQSGLNYNVRIDPLFTEVDISNVQLVKVASGEHALLFHLNEPGARKLYRQSVSNNGRVVIFEYGGKPIGARQIDGAISDGRYFTFVEMPYPELEAMVMEMQGDTRLMNEKLRESRF
ncbi:hypothetical protein [Cerasicoccus arenae]|nr:hypothetical protein [Cerasicoccus arenae]MBK1859414.1 hypothetical protein [Cerasicoccus arenae]